MNALKTNLLVGVYDAAGLVWGTCRANPCCPVASPVCRSMQKEIYCYVDAGTTETGSFLQWLEQAAQEEGALPLSPAETQPQGHSWALSSPSQSLVSALSLLSIPSPSFVVTCINPYPRKGMLLMSSQCWNPAICTSEPPLSPLPKAVLALRSCWQEATRENTDLPWGMASCSK